MFLVHLCFSALFLCMALHLMTCVVAQYCLFLEVTIHNVTDSRNYTGIALSSIFRKVLLILI